MDIFTLPVLSLLFLAALVVTAALIKPEHVHVGFPGPPAFARINTPRPEWDDEQRTVVLPNEDKYVIPDRARGHFVVLYEWPVKCNLVEGSNGISIPRGTRTDFASIPRIFHSLISPINNTIYSALLHDYIYRDPADSVASSISRESADRAFYWGMRACGVWRVTAGLMYAGVRIGGRGSYKRSQQADA